MRFDRLRAKGIGPFRNEVNVDFTTLEGPLVAVTGVNGAGKTTLLGLLGGACYREVPTRGSLVDLATARDAFLEVSLTNGAPHVVRHTIDCISGKSEALVCDAAGTPRIESTKVTAFDDWAKKHLPPKDVMYASTFAAQGSSGFLGMRAGERKSVLLRCLGVEKLEALSERAREKVRETKATIATIEARLSDERARATDPVEVQEEIDALHAERASLANELAVARAALDEATASEQLARMARQDIDAHIARRNELTARLQKLVAQKCSLDTRIANNRGVLGRADEIRHAIARAAELDATIAKHTASLAEAKDARAKANAALEAAEMSWANLKRREEDANERLLRATGRLADKATIERAVAALEKLRGDVEVAEGDVSATECRIEEMQAFALNSATTRIDGLRDGLANITAGRGGAAQDLAADTICADDELASKAEETPSLLVQERALLRDRKAALAAALATLAKTERIAARAAEMKAAEADKSDAERELADIAREQTKLPRLNELRAATEGPAAAVVAYEKALQNAMDDRAALSGLVGLADRLRDAESRLAELQPQADALAADIEAATKDLDALGDLPEDVELPDLDAARAKMDAAAAKLSGNEAAIAVKTAQLADAKASLERIAKIQAEMRAAEEDLSDWQRLADDLGRDGLQAILIDAAGPELTELVNDLLRTCVGSRWTVTIEASRLSADGKKTLEGCEVRVIDSEKGREGAAETLSGGERVIVGEAVSLALAMLACRRSGIEGPSLVRDESGAALDPANARAYVQMLRRAAELVGASRVFVVSHDPNVQELCDSRIEVKDGRVEVAA